jgi:hypothetical protein
MSDHLAPGLNPEALACPDCDAGLERALEVCEAKCVTCPLWYKCPCCQQCAEMYQQVDRKRKRVYNEFS